ncbi:MAG: response regulator [Deltaproteobacteria bacterium]|nr:response regulator [Deltaproteobacteria bacterium]MBW2071546.1 response regulator [Deltaproteobacteria bacterium]
MKNIKVLLVDDETDFVKALAERLQMRDLRSDAVYDGEQALTFVDEQEPDVMILDLKMPGIDGMEVLRRVKKAYPNIQVIILTGHGTEKDEEEARRLGAFDYLEKPVNLDVLVRKMKEAYQRKMEDAMVAATFAEAGEFETAKEVMEEDEKE